MPFKDDPQVGPSQTPQPIQTATPPPSASSSGTFKDEVGSGGTFKDTASGPAPGGTVGNAHTAPSNVLDYGKQLWLKNGGDPKAADQMARVMANESAGNAGIADGVTGTHIGLWQISKDYAPGENLRDPNTNAKHAIKLYNQRVRAGGDGFSDWEDSRGKGAYGGWGSPGSTPAPAQTTSAEALAKRDTRTAATHEQSRPDPHLSAVAPYSTPTPGAANPLGGVHSDALPAVMKYINDKLGIAGKAVTGAGTAVKTNVYQPGNNAWQNLMQALQHGSEHGIQVFSNVEGTLMRGVEQIHVDESNREAALVKKGVSPVPGPGMVSPATAKAIISTAADYFQHPQHMKNILNAMTDPSQAQTLTDTLEKNWASEMGLPAPEHWGTVAKVGASILTEAGHDPLSYVNPFAVIGDGMKVLSASHLGTGVATAVGQTLKAAAKTVRADKVASAARSVKWIDNGIDGVQQTSKVLSAGGKQLYKWVSDIRPDLDAHFSNEGKMATIGLSEHVDTVINDRNAAVGKIFGNHPNLDKLSQHDPIPDDIKLDRIKTAYRYGSAADARKAEKLAPQYGWQITAEEKAHSAQGYVRYGNDFTPKEEVDPGFMSRIESAAEPKAKWSETALADLAKPLGFETKPTMGPLDPNDRWLDPAEDLTTLEGKHSMRDLLSNSYRIENEAIRRGMLIKKTSELATSVPGLLSATAEAAIKAGTKKVHITAANFSRRFEITAEARRASAENYITRNVSLKAPQFVGKGVAKTVLGGLRDLSNLWKSSLAGTGLLVHSMRNVGSVMLMQTGSPLLAAQGLMRGLKGVSPELIERMKAGGSYSNFWRETPQILQHLGVRMGAGAVAGGAAGNASTPENASPLDRMKDIGIGAAGGAAYGAGILKMTELMDRFENGFRSVYLEHLDEGLGPVRNAADEFARNAKVSQDLGGYSNTTGLVSFLQGIGGTFVNYRVGTVPRAAATALLKHPGTVGNAERAQQNIGAQLPTNQGSDPSDLSVQPHALGGIDEGIDLFSNPLKFGMSSATIGVVPGGVVKHFEDSSYNKTHPQSLGQQATSTAYGALGAMPGGAVLQNAIPGLSPYKDETGLPIWAQELLHLVGVYATKVNRKTEKLEAKGYNRARSN